MQKTYLLDQVQILHGSKKKVVVDAALIKEGKIAAFGEEARRISQRFKIRPYRNSEKLLLAPCLVDPHSYLTQPFNDLSENLSIFRVNAANAGYGQVGILPRSPLWRDCSDRLKGFEDHNSHVELHLWGSFSKGGEGRQLAPHADLLQNGAIGLVDDDAMLPLELISQAFQLNEFKGKPILIAPRDKRIQGDGLVRESVEALQAGWVPDPIGSETIPLSQLIEIHRLYPFVSLRLMNISTKDGVEMINSKSANLMTSVSWWHLITDSSALEMTDMGWRVTPSLGGKEDRKALLKGLQEKRLNAIAVNSISLDPQETALPPQIRTAGLSGHNLVLPFLWQELIAKDNWPVEDLWNGLSFGPSEMIGVREESLKVGSNRWLLFDPEKKWHHRLPKERTSRTANIPFQEQTITGEIIDCGLIDATIQLY
tara:strand:+ start:213 stop:1490 length:1278 start_codon:yes stop_codon:yes gene_type:complete